MPLWLLRACLGVLSLYPCDERCWGMGKCVIDLADPCAKPVAFAGTTHRPIHHSVPHTVALKHRLITPSIYVSPQKLALSRDRRKRMGLNTARQRKHPCRPACKPPFVPVLPEAADGNDQNLAVVVSPVISARVREDPQIPKTLLWCRLSLGKTPVV